MAISLRVSALSCANSYNHSLLQLKVAPPGWPANFTVSSDYVWDSFILLSLLENTLDCGEVLTISHTGIQHTHFTKLIQARNLTFCFAVITDGIYIGHPCCSAYNCKVLLSGDKDHFCHIHIHLEGICASNPQHPKIHAKFTSSRIYNEQLIVVPCEIILGHDTMFSTKRVASIAVHCDDHGTLHLFTATFQEFLRYIFHIEILKPNHIIFDNNYSLAQHIKRDPFFEDIGLSVDVFHFKSKYKQSHIFCQKHCNSTTFLELLSVNGKSWFFNSSITE
ncbi:hypothetical protein HD554DRAFT_2022001 [Boletus coccyginus]|nr:hypothetical protein HD554DRAFT_2022001 [Boletus coccyginus]